MLLQANIRQLTLLLLLCASHTFAQKNTAKKMYSLDELLSFLEQKHQVVFSFDHNLVKDVPVSADTSKNIYSLLDELSLKTAFSFDRLDKKNILIRPKSTGTNFVLSGSVIDGKTHEPLYSAIVFSKKSRISTACNEDGTFHKLLLYIPDDTISVFLAGYGISTIPVKDFGSGEPQVIAMKSKLVEINEVSVTAYMTSGVEYDAMDNSITIRPKNRTILPGQTNGDILLSLDALPGISSTDSKAGNLNIRGSSPDQTLITFDNIPLYQKGHVFGTVSSFNANVVDNIKVQRTSMSANKGGRVGGVVEINTPSNVVNNVTGTVAGSLLDASAYVHVPVIKNKMSFFVSGRHSYPYSWKLPPMQAISDYIFQMTEISGALSNNPDNLKLALDYSDYNAKLIYNITEKHKVTLSGLYNTDYFGADMNDASRSLFSYNDIRMLNTGVSGTVTSNWKPSFSTQLILTSSYYNQHNKNKMDSYSNVNLATSSYDNTVRDLRACFEAQWRISPKHILKTGYDMNSYHTSYDRESNDNTNVSLRRDYINNGMLHTTFVNWLSTPLKKMTIDAGIRLNYFTVNGKFSPEPRLVMGYRLHEHFRLKASGGYQKQFISQVSGISIQSIGGLQSLLWLLCDDKNIPVVNSYQYAFGGLFEKKTWLIDIEAYYKQTDNIANISITSPLRKDPFIHGSVNTIGTDLLIKKRWGNLDTWVSYTLGKSIMQFDSVQADPFYSLFDQTHILDVAGSYQLKQWKFSLAWKYRSGFAVLQGIRTRMMAGAESTPKIPGQTTTTTPPPPGPSSSPGAAATADGHPKYTDRFPDYHMLDASVQYSFPKVSKSWSGFVGASVLNCYDQQNILNQLMISNKGVKRLTNNYMMGMMPNLTLSFSF